MIAHILILARDIVDGIVHEPPHQPILGPDLELFEGPQDVQRLCELLQVMIDLEQGQVAPLHQVAHAHVGCCVRVRILHTQCEPRLRPGSEGKCLLLIHVKGLCPHPQPQKQQNYA